MPPNQPTPLIDPPSAWVEPDVAWPLALLDHEPETCHCLVHGTELPCPHCAPTLQHWKEERTVA
jgi:hypothetical protein